MRELVGGKNTIGRTAAVLKSPIKRPLPLPLPNYMTPHTTRQEALLFSVCFYIFQVAVPGGSWKLQSARLEVSSLSGMHVLP